VACRAADRDVARKLFVKKKRRLPSAAFFASNCIAFTGPKSSAARASDAVAETPMKTAAATANP